MNYVIRKMRSLLKKIHYVFEPNDLSHKFHSINKYTIIQKFGVSIIFEEVSYIYQDCISLFK